MRAGDTKRYVCNEKTVRPNQIFVCNTCGALRPKLSKMNKHLNVHNKKKKRVPAQTQNAAEVDRPKLPLMHSFVALDMPSAKYQM